MPGFKPDTYDPANPLAIFEHSSHLIGRSLRSLLGDKAVEMKRDGKGGLGQMVEELFFGYGVDSNREADFAQANVELKCTPLLKSGKDASYRVKERLVCTMIDYFEVASTPFASSHLLAKCRLMLILFYMYVSGRDIYDYEFLYRVLWQLPEKDLKLIERDYETIAAKVRRGEAHLLSEGDTIYLGAARKGQKSDAPQAQPYSDAKAPRRAFSLKPAYMRHILSHVSGRGDRAYTNYSAPRRGSFELVTSADLAHRGFEEVILGRFAPFQGMDYPAICDALGIGPYQAKSKYADAAALIASGGVSKRLSRAEEFVKSGIVMKTLRLRPDGTPCESISFKNIDYREVYDNDEWTESEAYELFTGRFLFVVFAPVPGETVTIPRKLPGESVTEPRYVLHSAFFWTMPAADLEVAREYWQSIRGAVLAGNIRPQAFWSIADHRKFHVRPKARVKADKTPTPHGGEAEKFCYWLNAEYVKEIVDSHRNG